MERPGWTDAPRLTRLALRTPVLYLAVVFVLTAAALAFGLGGLHKLSPFTADDPSSESVQARELVGQASGVDPDFGVIALVAAPEGVSDPSARQRVRQVARILDGERLVTGVRTYYQGRDPALVATNRRSSYVVAGLKPVKIDAQLEAARRIRDQLDGVHGVKVGGRAMFYANGNDTARRDLVRSELLVLPFLGLLLLWVFRGVAAALLPLAVGAVTVAGALGLLRLLSLQTDVSIYAFNIVTALGTGLAIDYSLLLITRYREEALRAGYRRATVLAAVAHTGRTVFYSSLTVAAAAVTLAIFPQPFLRSIAAGAAIVALLAGAAALTVLPAALTLLGDRLEWGTPRRWREAIHRAAQPAERGFWYRLSRLVARRPGRIAVATGIGMLVLAFPVVDLETTAVDASVVPRDSSDRQVAEAFAREGRTQPIVIATRPPANTPPRRLDALRRRIAAIPGIASAGEPQQLQATRGGRDVWRIDALPTGPALSDQSQRAARTIRALAPGYPIAVGGETAGLIDLKDSLWDRLPFALVLLFALTGFAIFRATRSVVLPIKTFLMNLATVAATFGLLVIIFQDGRYEGVLDYTSSGALEASVLVLIFAVAFGLATDYGMFLLGRIKEGHDRGLDNTEAVATGLERTGRVVSQAALLLCVALGSLVTAEHALVKQVGIGCALAVAIDATIVRALLVPSLMALLGRWNWWAPKPLLALAPAAEAPALPPTQTGTRRLDDDLPPDPATLTQGHYCDSRHPDIHAALADQLNGREDDRQVAETLFRFVRDNVLYEFGPWGVSASTTLARGAGTCTNKANLLIALLRASGIPAAYGVLRVDARHYFGPIGPEFLTDKVSGDSTHIYAAAFLNGRWVRCDPSTDGQLASLTSHFCRQTQLVEWDGHTDALDFLDPAHVHADLGLQADADPLLGKPARNADADLLAFGNDYLAFIRAHPPFASAQALIDAYSANLSGRWERQSAQVD